MTSSPQQSSRLSKFQTSIRAGTGSLRKSVKAIFSSPPSSTNLTSSSPPPTFVVFGVLGIAGPLKELNVGSMVTDYVVWVSSFWQLPGLDRARSQLHSIRPLGEYFPNGKVNFGEAACSRLQLPVPPDLDKNNHSGFDETQFSTHCKYELLRTADAMKPGETLVILLIGHGATGTPSEGRFRFYITTDYERDGSVWLTKFDLEQALEGCRGEIIVVCNSCNSWALKSPLWTLLCAAGSKQDSEFLTTSSSGDARGSAFTFSTLAQAGQDQGLVFLFPQNEPRSRTNDANTTDSLPACLATHTFEFSSSQEISAPTKLPLSQFLQGMMAVEYLFVMDLPTRFQQDGSRYDIPWHCVLPLIFEEAFVRQIKVYSVDSSLLNELYHPAQGDASIDTSVEEQRCLSKTLFILMEAFLDIPHSPHTRDGRIAKLASDVLQNKNTRFGAARSLMNDLYTQHIQAVVVQELARHLEWRKKDSIVPFFSAVEQGKNALSLQGMIESGLSVDLILDRLPPFWPCIHLITDQASSLWIAGQWAEAGFPSLSLQRWEDAVDAAAKSAKPLTLVTDEDDFRKLLPLMSRL